MKKIIVLMTAVALASALSACGKSDAANQDEARKKFYSTPTPAKLGL